MGKTDNIMYRYMSNKERFADLFNGILFQGRNIILPDQLSEASGKYTAISQELIKRSRKQHLLNRNRDIKMLLQSGGVLRILTVENQKYIDYSMPLRCMEYDVLEYRKQLDELRNSNQIHKAFTTKDEFLCGLKSDNRLSPVYTICLYHGEADWNGPWSLADMMDFQSDTDLFRPFFADYPFRLFCINAQPDFETFHSELKLFFMALNQRGNPDGLQQLMTEYDAYQHLSPDTAETLATLLDMPQIWEKREEYMNQNREDYDMCYAVQKWHEQDISKGMALGREDKTRQIVTNMLKRGFSDEDISALAECSQAMIDEMRGTLT
ncbi:MAG: Rpn family recombination-promoting nuclease/putative transposase [Eubacterium sp.]|nr:Rpn family recombination-promoting nuclease/putative transposase [Eubacterium sp.]MCM1213647.1 Rpn family recombination-promoting nuclease/putative transposase [Lachnospiraceae bacterium]MCM1302780.1 Rpn family recombination-promoting nuclease/putative transposase [Butyrivibrio sp.]MCM1342502.1 Rpn family recombination-promoting nuclease/putative transposase [Muribaculaceae bacterium]MCM1237769.1 Rpn family recombination-promoting nuclease/putative transposase [Lachnospiraceae bacterium]